jgi:uncharacterized membrane protein YbhN (UPF0104 family)
VFSSDATTSYPTVRLAVLAAVVLVAGPFLTRPVRRCGQLVLLVVVPGTLILGLGGVDAVTGAVAVGWGVAAMLHLALGSPAGRPTMAQVAAALAELGVATTAVELAPEQPTGSTIVVATRPDGPPLRVRVYGRDAADTGLVAKAWRFLAYKDSGPTLTLSRLQQVEHEAVCLFAARAAGAHVPVIVAAGIAGPSAALLALDQPDHRTLTEVAAGHDLDAGVAALWDGLRNLRDARVSHGALDGEHVLVGDGTATLVDFDKGSISASPVRLDVDVAQALVATALRIDAEPAVDAAARILTVDELRAAQRYLTKPALTPATRRALRGRKALLDEITAAVAARTDGELVRPVELRRVKPLNVVMVVALLFALWVILGQVGSLSDLWATLKTADWPWLLVGFVLAQSTSVAFACNTIGSVPQPVPLVPAVLLQMAVSFVNLVAPTGASAAIMNIRFLQKQGVEVGAATSSGVLLGLAGTVTQFTLFVLTAIAVGQEASLSDVGGVGPDHGERSLILLLVLVAAIVVGIALSIRPLRRFLRDRVWPQVVGALRNIWGIFTTPRQLFMIMGGSVAAQLLYSLCLLSGLAAYGGSLSVAEIVFVNTSASFLASLVPVPGGIGVMEAAMVSGLTAFGIPPEIATATVVTHRLFTTYLPPIWGNFATKKLITDGYL